MRKKTIVCMVMLTLCLSLFASGSQSSGISNQKVKASDWKPGTKVTLTFWLDNTTPEREAEYQTLIKDFKTKQPDISVDFLGVPGDIKPKLDVAIAGGAPPDCSTLVQNALSSYIIQNALVALDDYLAAWPDKDKIVPSALDTIRSFNPNDTKLYGLPFAANVWVLWVRPDWFKVAGLPLPETWEQFFTAAKVLTDKTQGRYGLAIRGGAGGGTSLEYMMYAYSGILDYFDKDGKCTVNNPKNVEFVKRYLGLYNQCTAEGDLNNGWPELAAAFQSGKVAMILHNLGSSAAHAKIFSNDYSKFAAIRIPHGDAGYTVHPRMNVSGYTIYTKCKAKDAAWAFISYLCSPKQASEAARVVGIMPVNIDALKDKWIEDLPYFKMASEMFADPTTKFYAAPINYPEYSSIITTSVEPMIQQVMAGRMSAQKMCDDWAGLMTQMKADYDKKYGTAKTK